MKFSFCAATVAAVLVCGVVTSPANAARKPDASSGLRGVQIDCMKQFGGYEDPQTHRMMMHGGLTDMQPKIDAIYACVAQKTGKPAAPFLTEQLKWN
jgi:hypothetical protein